MGTFQGTSLLNTSHENPQITKGLLVRGHASAQSCADRLFDLFGDAAVSWDAARAIGEIAWQDKILTKKNHAVVKVS